MPKKPSPDAENPEWTPEKFARSKRFDELPQGLRQAIGTRGGLPTDGSMSVGTRGPQKSPTKTLISLRLSPDVLAALRATGKGWQSAVDEALRRAFVK